MIHQESSRRAAVRPASSIMPVNRALPFRIAAPAMMALAVMQFLSCSLASVHESPSGQSEVPASAQHSGDGREGRQHLLFTGSLMHHGRLSVANSNEIVPWDALLRLKKHCSTGQDYDNELRPLIAVPAKRAYSLIYSTEDGTWTRISSVDNLWGKVRVDDEDDAAVFFDLIGGPLTKPFFLDARGWEIRRHTRGWSQPYYCELPDSRFEALGLQERKIERVHGGFIVRRAMYMPEVSRIAGSAPFNWPGAEQHPPRIVQAREFVSTEGFYLFGIDRIICEADDCPSLVLPDRDAMKFAFSRASTETSMQP